MVSSQIIDVINELCKKFGIAIDWSQKNIQPYLENLVTKSVNYKLYTSIMWIIVGTLLLVCALVSFGISKDSFNKYQLYRKTYRFHGFGYRTEIVDEEGYAKYEKYEDYDDRSKFYKWIAVILIIISIVLILWNINNMIVCTTFPEKILFDMVKFYME